MHIIYKLPQWILMKILHHTLKYSIVKDIVYTWNQDSIRKEAQKVHWISRMMT